MASAGCNGQCNVLFMKLFQGFLHVRKETYAQFGFLLKQAVVDGYAFVEELFLVGVSDEADKRFTQGEPDKRTEGVGSDGRKVQGLQGGLGSFNDGLLGIGQCAVKVEDDGLYHGFRQEMSFVLCAKVRLSERKTKEIHSFFFAEREYLR